MNNSIFSYIEKIVEKYPNKDAFCDENRCMTFAQLQEEAKKIAGTLIQRQIVKKPVLVYLEKSVGCLSCFMGIAYSGCYYTPIDTSMPVARIQKIMEVLHPTAIITDAKLQPKVNEFCEDSTILLYEDLLQANTDETVVLDTVRRIIDTDLLYVLFTSGSTGMPKGVAISHRAVLDFAEAVIERFEITEQEIFANQGPFYFDLSVLDIYCTLFAGATMYIVPPQYFKFPMKLLQYIRDKQINALFWVPSALVVVANLRALRAVDVTCLRKIMFCGEVMPCKQLNEWKKHVPNALYVNMYGPTETTCASTYYIVDREFEDTDILPIGKAFCNTDIMLLTEHDTLALPGEIGEICIRGTSLSVGYYDDEMKTAEVFVQNPLQKKYKEIIYKTGDLAKYNAAGDLLYISRKDFQIKHMGHRIELGEIEAAIMSVPKIEECCCLYDDNKNKIVAFITGNDVNEDYIEDAIEQILPDYMKPNRYCFLPDMPHNLNGKVDRTKLKELL